MNILIWTKKANWTLIWKTSLCPELVFKSKVNSLTVLSIWCLSLRLCHITRMNQTDRGEIKWHLS